MMLPANTYVTVPVYLALPLVHRQTMWETPPPRATRCGSRATPPMNNQVATSTQGTAAAARSAAGLHDFGCCFGRAANDQCLQ